ncbi:MAG: glycosyltransferase [Muribaculaceae bacterium]
MAISFLQPHNFVLHKVRAKKKICWIHTDYSTIHINREMELPVWSGYDYIASISEDCTKAFVKTFPELAPKIIEIENILSPQMIRTQADEFNPEDEMPERDGETRILSIGRYSYPKRFDEVARMCRIMLDMGAKFRWYIIGYGDDKEIRRTIEEYDVADTLILLGKKVNPYPYIRRCHIYAQPSRYEGKSVTVREAQILCKPVAITAYPTATSQVNDGVDGVILPYETDAAACALASFITEAHIQQQITTYLKAHDYGNEQEVRKIYKMLK